MRIPVIIAAAIVLQSTPGYSEILYARRTRRLRTRNTVGERRRSRCYAVEDSLRDRTLGQRREALEIRLLHALGAQETVYSVDLGSLQTAPRWQGSENAKLIIRGQLEGSAARGRALTTVVPYRIARFRL